MTKQLAIEFRDDLAAPRAAAGLPVGAAKGKESAVKTASRRASRARAAAATARLRAPAFHPAQPAPSLRLDEQTRAIGMRGVEQARRALAGIGGTAA